MQISDLEKFKDVPFLLWVKDEEGRYLWGNHAICDFAKRDVTGKTDYELPWAETADALRENDRQVFETGAPDFTHEYVDKSSKGKATLNVCKFIAELDGKKHVFGISFVIDD